MFGSLCPSIERLHIQVFKGSVVRPPYVGLLPFRMPMKLAYKCGLLTSITPRNPTTKFCWAMMCLWMRPSWKQQFSKKNCGGDDISSANKTESLKLCYVIFRNGSVRYFVIRNSFTVGLYHHCYRLITKYTPVNHQNAGLENSRPSLTVFARKKLKIFRPAIG